MAPLSTPSSSSFSFGHWRLPGLSAMGEIPVLDAISGIKRAPTVVESEAEVRVFFGAIRVCSPLVAAARCFLSFFLIVSIMESFSEG